MTTLSPTPAITARRLTKRFGRATILDELDLAVFAGECVAITGGNGSGKTTLLNCLSAVYRPTAGEVRWFDRPAAQTPALRNWVGVVSHESLLYPTLTARENLVFAARMHDVHEPARRSDELLQNAGLAPYAATPARSLSRGMRQRLAILRAIVHEPPLLLLDEPFAALDAAATTWLVEWLHDLRCRGRTLCFSSHDPLFHLCRPDRNLRLHAGRLREEALPAVAVPAQRRAA